MEACVVGAVLHHSNRAAAGTGVIDAEGGKVLFRCGVDGVAPYAPRILSTLSGVGLYQRLELRWGQGTDFLYHPLKPLILHAITAPISDASILTVRGGFVHLVCQKRASTFIKVIIYFIKLHTVFIKLRK